MTDSVRQLTRNDPSTVIVDGGVITRVESPETPGEVAELLATADTLDLAVTPVGGGTRLGLGNVPERTDVALSLRRLNRVLAYEPADLTLSVEAGATLAEIQQALGEKGQWLPIEGPLIAETTIGGLIATAFSGPRRLGSDSLRDLIVGVSVAHPTGAVSKAGGTVVKNVTGFDMMRLYHGSLGTLGVIVSANFKVLPRPRTETTRISRHATLDEALTTGRKLLELRGRPVALEVVSDAGGWLLAVRYEGRDGTVALMIDESKSVAGAPERTIERSESAAWWQTYVDFYTSGRSLDRVLLRATTRPRDTPALAAAAVRASADAEDAEIRVSPGLGRVDIALPASGGAESERDARLDSLRGSAASLVLFDVPVEWKAGRDIWGAPPETLDVMRALKDEFDPKRLLNPGRFAGSI